MAQFHNRRGPNVSQYIANLNTIPSAADMTQQEDLLNFDGDLELFTNTDFYDFDLNAPISDANTGLPFSTQSSSPTNPTADKMNFVEQPQFFQNPFGQFRANPTLPGRTSLPPSPPNGVPFAGQIQQSQPTIPSPSHFATALTPPTRGPQTGDKRKAGMSTIPSPAELEEQARNAAEEDKRRRNTAASARFRVKKKQREQALEKTAKEMSDRVQVLEARIGQLEMENQWLKGLITEKNVKLEGSPLDGQKKIIVPAKKQVDITAQSIHDDSESDGEEDVERTPSQKKRGVGTD